MTPSWLTVTRGEAPLVVSLPHTGTTIPAALESRLTSAWLARKDADWHVDRLYAFAAGLGATVVHTAISRTVIDVNRDPGGVSLYPGQTTTGLCPTETFDGEPLYASGDQPSTGEIAERRGTWFDPYHDALAQELARLSAAHPRVVLYDAHSIRSVIPRLFTGELPHFNVGTDDGRSCDRALTGAVEQLCDATRLSRVTNGRFKGGYITRHYGRPEAGIHAIQMELACRGYMPDPPRVDDGNWPPAADQVDLQMARTLELVLRAVLAWTRSDPAAEAATGAS
jgi:N-formylglutamate deformylase